jgi:hypothetical protein
LRIWLQEPEPGTPTGWSSLPFDGGGEAGNGFGDDLATLDFDGDHFLDLALGSHRPTTREILLRGGETPRGETLAPLPNQAFTSAVAAADFDHDGRDELAVGMRARGGAEREVFTAIDLYDFEDSSWRRRSIDSQSGQAGIWSLAAADLDGDGRADLAVGGGDGTISLLIQQADGTFQRELSPELSTETSAQRAGCKVRDLQVVSLAPQQLHLVALFAGEPAGSSDSPTYEQGCPNGGRVAVWRIDREKRKQP